MADVSVRHGLVFWSRLYLESPQVAYLRAARLMAGLLYPHRPAHADDLVRRLVAARRR